MISSTTTLCVLVLMGVAYGQLAGGRSTVASNDATVLDLAAFAVSGISSDYALGEVLSAEKQVVAGVKYYISASVTKTDAQQVVTNLNCDFEVLEHWLEPRQRLLNFSCAKA